MSDSTKAFWETKSTGFIPGEPAMDLLHPETTAAEPGAALTETQYLGFNVPEHDIHGLCYLWHHPNLGVVTGGAWAWQGVKATTLDCELFDMLTYVDEAVLAEDLHRFELPNSYAVELVEPLGRLRMHYADERRGNLIDLDFKAMMEPMVQSSGMHFEQGMKVTGTLRLAGADYEVDGYTVRDRSWGALRHEAHAPLPPMTWMTCVFGDDFAFGTTAFDSLDREPEWLGIMEIPGGDPVRGGWVLRDGALVPVVSASKRTIRNRRTLFPEAIEMTITDADGRAYEISGTVTAAAPWQTWHNMQSVICLTRWECEGRVGYGDAQEVLFHDYIRAFLGSENGRLAVA
jgi:hypothetical protein